MTAFDYSELRIDGLIRKFIAGAQYVGAGWNMAGKPDRKSPEAIAVRQELYAIGAQLLACRALPEIFDLFDHSDRNVRMWAVGQFAKIDSARSSCAILGFGQRVASGIGGAGDDLTATEAMAFRRRALQRPPRRPKLSEMTVEQLVARFEDACIRQYGARFVSDARGWQDIPTRNRIVSEISLIVGELHARDAVAALLPMLDHPNQMVRYVAATYCLPLATEKALPIIEAMAKGQNLREFYQASNTLDDWRRGIFTKLDYPKVEAKQARN
jgi:HEAT repeat protein